MRLATTLRLTLAALALGAWTGAAAAQAVGEPIGGFMGYTVHDHSTQTTHLQPNAPAALPVVIYDNTASAANFGFSSTDLTAIWGDELATTGTARSRRWRSRSTTPARAPARCSRAASSSSSTTGSRSGSSAASA